MGTAFLRLKPLQGCPFLRKEEHRIPRLPALDPHSPQVWEGHPGSSPGKEWNPPHCEVTPAWALSALPVVSSCEKWKLVSVSVRRWAGKHFIKLHFLIGVRKAVPRKRLHSEPNTQQNHFGRFLNMSWTFPLPQETMFVMGGAGGVQPQFKAKIKGV